MDLTNLSSIIQTSAKIMVLIGLTMYALFAVIMVRQEQLMDKVIDETFKPVLRVLISLHALAAIGLVVFAFITL